ncbi:uncharacterized protein LOC128171168 [Crassostrea angulata]|uniref:uncharacterized protein LOC128171168 n=1 Tax=Magallana angulata TaxID=2784310 RepID=UPI0022B0BE08|nr:uncharacterized protein LOC128171168 [Crassostrea angulata]
MGVLYLIALSGLFRLVYCYENLCRRPTTVLTQSSTYDKHEADFANDGDVTSIKRFCASTDIKRPKAWLQADLGESFSIKSVKLYFANDDFWILAHNREFYLDVSELPARHSTTKQRTRCYTDTTSAPELPRNIINIPCNHTGRYVIVETNYILPREEGAILEICEIEILGCEVGRFGENCKQCIGCHTCDIVSGECVFTPITKQQNVNEEKNFFLYAVIAVLCISLTMNGFMLTCILRQRTSRIRNATQEIKRCAAHGINNTIYQELRQVGGSPQYDQLQISSPGFMRR